MLWWTGNSGKKSTSKQWKILTMAGYNDKYLWKYYRIKEDTTMNKKCFVINVNRQWDVPAAQEIPVSVKKGKIEKKRLDAASYKAASNPSP